MISLEGSGFGESHLKGLAACEACGRVRFP